MKIILSVYVDSRIIEKETFYGVDALHTPGEWPRVAEFRVESRNDDGGTEIEHWSVQKARV